MFLILVNVDLVLSIISCLNLKTATNHPFYLLDMKHLNSHTCTCNPPYNEFACMWVGSQQICFLLVLHFPSRRLFLHFHDSVNYTFGDGKTKQCICIICLYLALSLHSTTIVRYCFVLKTVVRLHSDNTWGRPYP